MFNNIITQFLNYSRTLLIHTEIDLKFAAKREIMLPNDLVLELRDLDSVSSSPNDSLGYYAGHLSSLCHCFPICVMGGIMLNHLLCNVLLDLRVKSSSGINN